MLRYQGMFFWQCGQYDRGLMTDCPFTQRSMQTLRKLPMQLPKRNKAIPCTIDNVIKLMRKHTTELNRTIDIGSTSKKRNTRLFKRFLPKTVNANLEQPLFVPVLRHPFDVR